MEGQNAEVLILEKLKQLEITFNKANTEFTAANKILKENKNKYDKSLEKAYEKTNQLLVAQNNLLITKMSIVNQTNKILEKPRRELEVSFFMSSIFRNSNSMGVVIDRSISSALAPGQGTFT